MGKPRPPSNVKKPWPDEAALEKAVLAKCETEFEKIFGRPWDPACKKGLHDDHKRLFVQDQEARKLWEDLRRIVGKIEGFAKRWGLSPADVMALPGNTPRGVSLVMWLEEHGSHVGRAKDDAYEMPGIPEGVRGMVIQLWERVDPRFLPYQSTKPEQASTVGVTLFPGGPDDQTLELSDRELAVVSLLCGSWPKINQVDLDAGISVAIVIDRERKHIENARKHRPARL
ncbi:hypothetical protein [Polyangium aurulentum]|uniref:hypothetical protein n=1 Tax=Polyangium aurulentum TaxID=2567896 RepID=UPI0010AE0407|nr:hypothetical protein [Polyangium aurulentum]UQA57480.1 hypothetical protein E8A73_040375 [Polyangium aurulentum]